MGVNCLVKPPYLPFISASEHTREKQLHLENHRALMVETLMTYTEVHSNRHFWREYLNIRKFGPPPTSVCLNGPQCEPQKRKVSTIVVFGMQLFLSGVHRGCFDKKICTLTEHFHIT